MQGLTTRHLVSLCGGFAHEAWCVPSRGDAITCAVQFNNAIFQYVHLPLKLQDRHTLPHLKIAPHVMTSVVNPASLLPCVRSQIAVKEFNARRVPRGAPHRRRLVAEGTFETAERAPASSEELAKEMETAEEPEAAIESGRQAGRRQDEALLQVKEKKRVQENPSVGLCSYRVLSV